MAISTMTREGDERIVSEFAQRHGLELLRFAYLISGDRHRAEDLLQEVLFAMYRRFGDTMPIDNPVAYARRAIVNANVTWLRRGMSGEVAVEYAAELADRTAAPASSDPGERDALWHALRRLPERQRTVLVMRYYLDAADRDIADALGARPGTVRSLASRGLDALRQDASLVLSDGDPA